MDQLASPASKKIKSPLVPHCGIGAHASVPPLTRPPPPGSGRLGFHRGNLSLDGKSLGQRLAHSTFSYGRLCIGNSARPGSDRVYVPHKFSKYMNSSTAPVLCVISHLHRTKFSLSVIQIRFNSVDDSVVLPKLICQWPEASPILS